MAHTNGTVNKNNKTYTEKDNQDALNAMKEDNLSLRDAERAFGVPKSTLARRSNGGLSAAASQATLSMIVENMLVDLIGHLEDIGYGINKKMFLDLVNLYLDKTKQNDLFKNGSPHPNFYFKFMNRHRDKLKTMKAQNISEVRAKSATPEVFDQFHDKPGHIYNCDESGFQPDPGNVRIITKTTTRNPYKLSANNPKATYTILVCGNALGEYTALNFIFKFHVRTKSTKTITKTNFARLIKIVVEPNAFDRLSLITAFNNCGVYPLDRNKISHPKTNLSLTYSNSSLPS